MCSCTACDACQQPLDAHEHVFVGDNDDSLRASLCLDCLAELQAVLTNWMRQRIVPTSTKAKAYEEVVAAARRLTAFNPDDTVDSWRFVDAWDALKSVLAACP